jgi:hypothetical protein
VTDVGLLNALAKKFTGKSDAELEQEVERLRDARRKFAQTHRMFRDTTHAGIDKAFADAAGHFELLLAQYGSDWFRLGEADLLQLAGFYGLRDGGLADRLHQAANELPDEMFSELTQVEYDAKLSKYDSELDAITTELERRQIAQAKEAAEAELQALEGKVTK